MDPIRTFVLLLFTLLLHKGHAANSTSITSSRIRRTHHSKCHEYEMASLLRFKDDLIINRCSPKDPQSYPKLQSWWTNHTHLDNPHTSNTDCCSWDGVHCHKFTGHITALDLSSSCLYGSINSSSSLFLLPRLRSLNLAFNDFHNSSIPPAISHFSGLRSLNLSHSSFSGQIPSTLSQLSKLSTLDLSDNNNLVFDEPVFANLVDNSTGLEYLLLKATKMSFALPYTLANLTSLKSLILVGCELHGECPPQVFNLPKLERLLLYNNPDLMGSIPNNFNSSSPLQLLMLGFTGFSGVIPSSIGNLASLNTFTLFNCDFFGKLPPSLSNLTKLDVMMLALNNFEPHSFAFFSWLGEITKLNTLSLSTIPLTGKFPESFSNLTQLSQLFLYNCRISDQFPTFIYQFQNLKSLDLSYNNLTGIVNFDLLLLRMNHLQLLDLTKSNVSLDFNPNSTAAHQKFTTLGLGSCNLSHFPELLLRHQDQLYWLGLPDNNIHGEIPKWLGYASKDLLQYIDLSGNFLTGFEGSQPSSSEALLLQWPQAVEVHLDSNMFQGSLLPILPQSIEYFSISNNQLTGKIPLAFCRLATKLYFLDLSHNHFKGRLPRCLMSATLQVLKLDRNSFNDKIPQPYSNNTPGQCKLRVLILGDNQLSGEVPKSLANCDRLEFFILSNNRINDTFPSWLGGLPGLRVLVLRGNRFYGSVGSATGTTDQDFPKLKIVDLSGNRFSGPLPTRYILNWVGMKGSETDTLDYMKLRTSSVLQMYQYSVIYFWYTMTLTNKGTTTNYPKILQMLISVDLSNNRFEGQIPPAFGNLTGLRLLNLSANYLTGPIPKLLANLSKLESLDVSRNNLTGDIPHELAQLNFLAIFNVAENKLTGEIPRGKQFDTFPNDSYMGNVGLCGKPLSRKCGDDSEAWQPPMPSSEEEESGFRFEFEFGWRSILMGYGLGTVVGLVIGHFAVGWRYEWFLMTFRIGGRRTLRIIPPKRRK